MSPRLNLSTYILNTKGLGTGSIASWVPELDLESVIWSSIAKAPFFLVPNQYLTSYQLLEVNIKVKYLHNNTLLWVNSIKSQQENNTKIVVVTVCMSCLKLKDIIVKKMVQYHYDPELERVTE